MSPIAPLVSRSGEDCLVLNENERKIFSLLKECCKAYQLNVTLRVAGGWVRDKLLGIECHDCDIAIDLMMGQTFAQQLRAYLIERGIPSSAYGVIQANPERSKHLETATLTIYGYPIDFVNLRSESYSKDSRIPTIQFGSPLQDALRRDITINSLFYNIQSEQVEDYVGSGFADLTNRIVKTPLPPRETLLDDPLRLLRVIRFATRFQFRIDAALEAAIMDNDLDSAFRSKISRERVGAELDKILHDKHAYDGLVRMHQLGVFNLVFDLPPNLQNSNFLPNLPSSNKIEKILYIQAILISQASPSMTIGYNRRLALLSAALLPHLGIFIDRPTKKPEPLVSSIIRDSLKFSNQDMNDVARLFSQVEPIIDLVLEDTFNTSPPRVRIGRLVRTLGPHWEVAFHLACIHAVLTVPLLNPQEAVQRFLNAIKNVQNLGLDSAWSWQSILSGRDLQELIGLCQGPQIGILLASLLDWQYENPQGSRHQAIEYILEVAATLE